MLVCIAQDGLVYEIDPDGNNIWEKQVNGTVPHAYRYSACYLAGTVPNAPMISASGNVLLAEGGSAFQWYVDGVMIPGATLASHTAMISGNYQAQVVEAGGCRSPLSEGISITVNEVNEAEWSALVRVFPNPANESVRFAAAGPNTTFVVYDSRGRMITQVNGNSVVNTQAWPNGIYTATAASIAGTHQQRLIIQH